MGNQEPGFRVFQDKGQFFRGKAVIQRYQNGPDQCRGEISLQEDVAIIMENGQLPARSQTAGLEKIRQPKDPPGELLIGENPLMAAYRFLSREGLEGFD
jgi:hypothetical protein